MLFTKFLLCGLAFIGAWQVLRFGLNLWGDVRWEREVRRTHEDMRKRWAYLDIQKLKH